MSGDESIAYLPIQEAWKPQRLTRDGKEDDPGASGGMSGWEMKKWEGNPNYLVAQTFIACGVMKSPSYLVDYLPNCWARWLSYYSSYKDYRIVWQNYQTIHKKSARNVLVILEGKSHWTKEVYASYLWKPQTFLKQFPIAPWESSRTSFFKGGEVL